MTVDSEGCVQVMCNLITRYLTPIYGNSVKYIDFIVFKLSDFNVKSYIIQYMSCINNVM